MSSEHFVGPRVPKPDLPIPELIALPEIFKVRTTLRTILEYALPWEDPQGYLDQPTNISAREIPQGRGIVVEMNFPGLNLLGGGLVELVELRGKLSSIPKDDEDPFHYDAMDGAFADYYEGGHPETPILRSTIDHHQQLGEYWTEYMGCENEAFMEAMRDPDVTQVNQLFDLIGTLIVRRDRIIANMHRLLDVNTEGVSGVIGALRTADVQGGLREWINYKFGKDFQAEKEISEFISTLIEDNEIKTFLKDIPKNIKETLVDQAVANSKFIVIDDREVKDKKEASYPFTQEVFPNSDHQLTIHTGRGNLKFSFGDSWVNFNMNKYRFNETGRRVVQNKEGIHPAIRFAVVDGEIYYLSSPPDPSGHEHYLAGMVLAAQFDQDFIDGLPIERRLKGEGRSQRMMEGQAVVHVSLARKKLVKTPFFKKVEQFVKQHTEKALAI